MKNYNVLLTDDVLSKPFNMSSKNNKDNTVENLDNVNNSTNKVVHNNKEYVIPDIDVVENTFKDSTQDWFGREVPIMGPLDGLNVKEMNTRLQYLKQKTAYPYRPMTYADFETSNDKRIETDKTGLLNKNNVAENNKQEMERWYPDTTYLQMNARDCTNYEPNHPFSCIQNHPELLSKKEKLVEGFLSSIPLSLEDKLPHPTIFKNAMGPINSDNINPNDVTNISKNMSRGGTLGYCSKGVCGSKLLEEGNNNIIDVVNYVSSYLEDGVTI